MSQNDIEMAALTNGRRIVALKPSGGQIVAQEFTPFRHRGKASAGGFGRHARVM